MAYKKHTEDELQRYLLRYAEIRSFYILCFGDSSSGLITYFDSSGKSWHLMVDDDDLVEDAVEFLKNHGAPCFDNISAAQEFERNWGK